MKIFPAIGSEDLKVTRISNTLNNAQVPKSAKKCLRGRKRATLTPESALEIFLVQTKPEDEEDLSAPPRLERSVIVAEIYGISPKAIRDVWNRFVLPLEIVVTD